MEAPALVIHTGTKLKNLAEGVKRFWQTLTTSQKLYLTALISLMLAPDNLWLCSLFTVAALVIEFWPRFLVVFHSLPGKAFLLLFYATIANFVLAGAAGTVNEITGVSAEHFDYTHNFAILLYLPSWALGLTLFALLLLQLAMPFYIFVLLLLKPFKRFGIHVFSRNNYPVTTALLRFGLCSVVVTKLLLSMGDLQASSLDLNKLEKAFEEGKSFGVQINEDASVKLNLDPPGIGTPASEDDENKTEKKGYDDLVKNLIAQFAYYQEADSFSRCQKDPKSRVVELNDYEIVELFEDKKAPYGVRFEVRKCISPAFPAP